jgi:hypothetical protein
MSNNSNINNNLVVHRAIMEAERGLHEAAVAQAAELVPEAYREATAALIKCCVSRHYVEPFSLEIVLEALSESEIKGMTSENRLAVFVHVVNGGSAREWFDAQEEARRKALEDALCALGYGRERVEALDDIDLGDALQRARDLS